MTSKKLDIDSKGNRFISGVRLSEKEFSKGIRLAEEGEFTTVQESMTEFEQWQKKREKEKK